MQEIISTRNIYQGQIDYFMRSLPAEVGIPSSTPSKSPNRARDNHTEPSSVAEFRNDIINNKACLETPKRTIEDKRQSKRGQKTGAKLHKLHINDSEAKTTIQNTAQRDENQFDLSVSSKKKAGRPSSRLNHSDKVKSIADADPPTTRSKLDVHSQPASQNP